MTYGKYYFEIFLVGIELGSFDIRFYCAIHLLLKYFKNAYHSYNMSVKCNSFNELKMYSSLDYWKYPL